MVAVYGHRGAKGEAPENTLAGFEYALELGLSALELDVRLSADEELVVIHDDTVQRTTNGIGRVCDLTVEQLRRLDARGPHASWPEPVGVPTLAEVMEAFRAAQRIVLQIEVKRDAPERVERVCAGVARSVHEHDFGERAVVASFVPAALEIMRSLAPSLPRAFITMEDPAGSIDTALRLGCSDVDIQRPLLSPEIVREAHARGLGVMGWQGNTVADLEHLVACGVDKLTTDHPSVALPFLKARRS